jgi:hypothetical protein
MDVIGAVAAELLNQRLRIVLKNGRFFCGLEFFLGIRHLNWQCYSFGVTEAASDRRRWSTNGWQLQPRARLIWDEMHTSMESNIITADMSPFDESICLFRDAPGLTFRTQPSLTHLTPLSSTRRQLPL